MSCLVAWLFFGVASLTGDFFLHLVSWGERSEKSKLILTVIGLSLCNRNSFVDCNFRNIF